MRNLNCDMYICSIDVCFILLLNLALYLQRDEESFIMTLQNIIYGIKQNQQGWKCSLECYNKDGSAH